MERNIIDLTADNYMDFIKHKDCLKDVLSIKDILPHSYPFLLVDRVIKIEKENNYICAIKNVTHNEEFFIGHFPEYPIMPGVLIAEALAQVATIFAITSMLNITKEQCDVRFLSLSNAKFRKPVVPGDRLYMNVELVKQKGDIFKFVGRAYTESGLCTETEFTAAAFIKKAEQPIE